MIIFDSRIAQETYNNEPYLRSKSFDLEPGEKAHFELTTHKKYFGKITFEIVRVIRPEGKSDRCLSTEGYVKPYRFRSGCKAILGYDWKTTKNVYEFLKVDRPGRYYLIASKRCNQQLLDCEAPTIIETAIEKSCC